MKFNFSKKSLLRWKLLPECNVTMVTRFGDYRLLVWAVPDAKRREKRWLVPQVLLLLGVVKQHTNSFFPGYVPIHTPGFIYGSTYKESTETALKKFLENVERKRSEQRSLSRTAIHKQSLREREDYCKPATYPDINVAYSKNYTVSEYRRDYLHSSMKF